MRHGRDLPVSFSLERIMPGKPHAANGGRSRHPSGLRLWRGTVDYFLDETIISDDRHIMVADQPG
jgi:hypothetical protein